MAQEIADETRSSCVRRDCPDRRGRRERVRRRRSPRRRRPRPPPAAGAAAHDDADAAAASAAAAARARRRAPRPRTRSSRKSLDELNAKKPLPTSSSTSTRSRFATTRKPALQKDADWMKRWTSTKVMVEGHGDSRGTAEYNLALGERRAAAVRDYLVSLGVAADRRHRSSARARKQPSAPRRTRPAGSRTAAATS